MSGTVAVVSWTALAALFLLRVVAGLDPGLRLWGLGPHRFLGPFFGWTMLALVGLALLPPLAGRATSLAERLGRWVASSRRATWVAALAGASLAWLMFDQLWFTGDFLLRLGFAETAGEAPYRAALPLDRLLHGTLTTGLAGGSIWTANLVARVLGAVEAGAFAALAMAFGRAVAWGGPSGAQGVAAAAGAAGLFFGGYLTMFTGLGKPASEMCLLVAAVVVFGLEVLRGRRGLLALGLAVAVAFLVHRSCVVLLPAWAFAVVAWLRRPADARPERGIEAWAGLGIPLVVVALMLPRILSIAWAYDFPAHVPGVGVDDAGSWAALFGARRLAGMGNLLLALSPLGLLGPALLARRRALELGPKPLGFLFVLALSFVPVLVLIHPQHGAFKDWDVFAPAGVAWGALGVWVACRALALPRGAWLAVPLIASAVVPSFQWLALNRHLESGRARVRAYASEGVLASEEERAHHWDFLAARSFRLGHWAQASEAAGQAASFAPHRRVLLLWALSETMVGDHRSAQEIYRRILGRDPEDPIAWIGMVGSALRVGDSSAVARGMEKLGGWGPNSPEARVIERFLSHYPQAWPDSSELARGP